MRTSSRLALVLCTTFAFGVMTPLHALADTSGDAQPAPATSTASAQATGMEAGGSAVVTVSNDTPCDADGDTPSAGQSTSAGASNSTATNSSAIAVTNTTATTVQPSTPATALPKIPSTMVQTPAVSKATAVASKTALTSKTVSTSKTTAVSNTTAVAKTTKTASTTKHKPASSKAASTSAKKAAPKHALSKGEQNALYWLAHVINAEAGGQPMKTQIAVGDVVLHRVHTPSYGHTVKQVVFQEHKGHYQFSCVENHHIYQKPGPASIRAAKAVLLQHKDVVPHALVFYNPVFTPIQSWVRTQNTLKKIGALVFAI